MRVALATCLRLPEPDPDAGPLLEAARAAGAEADWAAWDDPSVDWAAYDLCAIRSTWDYIHRLPDFLTWAQRAAAATRLFNPLPIVRWSCDKSYLRDLEARGVPVVPTAFVPRGSVEPLAGVVAGRGWEEVVIKPQVGAASFATGRFPAASPEADAFLRRLAAERAALVQPYVKSVEGYGERSLIWIAGELTHAIRKNPRFGGQDEHVSTAVPIAPDESAFAKNALEPYAKDLLYARVDVARDDDGRLLVMELELIEPSLFLTQHPPAAERLAEAIVSRV